MTRGVAARRNDRTRREQASGVAGLALVQARGPRRSCERYGVGRASIKPKQMRVVRLDCAFWQS